jgi:signal transduction histidine kinase
MSDSLIAVAPERALDPASALLVEAVQRLSLARTVGEVQEIVRETARVLCGADGATFVLRDGPYCFYADEDAISPLWKGQRFPLETCVSGWVMDHREALAIPDIYDDERVPVEAYRPTFVKSLVMVPIRRMEPIGAIGNYWASEHNPTPRELELLQALADSTAVAMENVRVWSELEERIADRMSKLQEALELNERITGMLAHEIRNALAANVGMLDLTLMDEAAPLADGTRRHLELARRAADDGVRIVNDQLTAARDRVGALRPQPVDVHVSEVFAELEGTYRALRRGDGVALIVDAPGDLPVLHTDRHLLLQALRNLVSNALKYTDAGSVRVSARAVDEESVTFVVADTGVGISAEDQERVFDEWVQGSDARQGAGLGLPFVRRLATLLGGSLELESAVGVGTVVTLTIAVRDA